MDISEKNKQRRKDQSNTDVEQHKTADGVQEQDKFPGKRDMVNNTKDEEYAESQAKVNKCLNIFGKKE